MLEESTNLLLIDLAKMGHENLSKKLNNSWSILQVLSHLNTAESASLGYMKKKIQAGDKMGRITFYQKVRMKLTNLALLSPLKWKAPSYVANPQEPNNLDDISSDWKQTRSNILAFVEQYPDEYLDRLVYKHPMGGRQNLNNAIDSIINHQKHHIHQISRIKKGLKI